VITRIEYESKENGGRTYQLISGIVRNKRRENHH
jgi:hypothetical protein